MIARNRPAASGPSGEPGAAPGPAAKHAFVTLVTNGDYARGALALVRSIQRSGTSADIVVLHTQAVTQGRIVRRAKARRASHSGRPAADIRCLQPAPCPFQNSPECALYQRTKTSIPYASRQFCQIAPVAIGGIPTLHLHRCRCTGPQKHRPIVPLSAIFRSAQCL